MPPHGKYGGCKFSRSYAIRFPHLHCPLLPLATVSALVCKPGETQGPLLCVLQPVKGRHRSPKARKECPRGVPVRAQGDAAVEVRGLEPNQ